MLGGKKLWVLAICACLLLVYTLPAFAADRPVDEQDLKGIPRKHKYLMSVLAGAAVGAGVGALLSGGNDITKGLMIGGGGMSALYLHSHPRDQLNGWRDWAYIGSYSVFGSGMGWTLCGCDDGAVAGALIGGGATTAWRASRPDRRTTTATTRP